MSALLIEVKDFLQTWLKCWHQHSNVQNLCILCARSRSHLKVKEFGGGMNSFSNSFSFVCRWTFRIRLQWSSWIFTAYGHWHWLHCFYKIEIRKFPGIESRSFKTVGGKWNVLHYKCISGRYVKNSSTNKMLKKSRACRHNDKWNWVMVFFCHNLG